VNIKEAALLSIDAMNFEGEVETQVSDQISAGATYEQNSAKFAPKTLFTRWTAKGGDPLEVTATYNVAANSAEVDVDYENSGTRVQAALDSARKTILNTVELSRTFNVEGRDLEVSPAYDLSTKVASVKNRLNLNSDTTLELNLRSDDVSNRDALDARMTVEHAIDAQNSIKPSFSLKSGDVDYEYTRALGGDAELNVKATPGKDVNLQWEDPGSRGVWTTNVKMPWGQPSGASVSFKRKFNL